jgi:hypothetical protein
VIYYKLLVSGVRRSSLLRALGRRRIAGRWHKAGHDNRRKNQNYGHYHYDIHDRKFG